MTTLANAIHKAKKLAQETQATAYVIFDPTHLDNPPAWPTTPPPKRRPRPSLPAARSWTRSNRRTSCRDQPHHRPVRHPGGWPMTHLPITLQETNPMTAQLDTVIATLQSWQTPPVDTAGGVSVSLIPLPSARMALTLQPLLST